ncbi:MAG: nucleoside phosphorylase [Muribaculaceae bacterium]|nr:nucleoside phosphorylase [Muribaculaceae bacterium]
METDRFIPSSQLIINADNSAFHIHVKPEQLRDKIIMVGDPGRVSMVASYFDSIDYDVQSREFHAVAGKYKGKELMCISHGIGADNIEIVMTELDALANIDFKTRKVRKEKRVLELVRLGTSGSLQYDLKIGDFVIANRGMGFDGILNFYADRDSVCDLDFENKFCDFVKWNPLWARPYVVAADRDLVERIGRDDMLRGNTIASVGFYAPQGREVRLKLKDPGLIGRIEEFRYEGEPITNFEMESACLQGMARLLGHKAMTVCCIIAQRREEDANTDYKPSVAKLVETVLERI